MTPAVLLLFLHTSSFDACVNRHWVTSQNMLRCLAASHAPRARKAVRR